MPKYVFVIASIFFFAFVLLTLAMIWFPNYVSPDLFIKLTASFFIVLIGSIIFSWLGKSLTKSDDKE